jgi:hypothetical protein
MYESRIAGSKGLCLRPMESPDRAIGNIIRDISDRDISDQGLPETLAAS